MTDLFPFYEHKDVMEQCYMPEAPAEYLASFATFMSAISAPPSHKAKHVPTSDGWTTVASNSSRRPRAAVSSPHHQIPPISPASQVVAAPPTLKEFVLSTSNKMTAEKAPSLIAKICDAVLKKENEHVTEMAETMQTVYSAAKKNKIHLEHYATLWLSLAEKMPAHFNFGAIIADFQEILSFLEGFDAAYIDPDDGDGDYDDAFCKQQKEIQERINLCSFFSLIYNAPTKKEIKVLRTLIPQIILYPVRNKDNEDRMRSVEEAVNFVAELYPALCAIDIFGAELDELKSLVSSSPDVVMDGVSLRAQVLITKIFADKKKK